jgi:uncharacterized protein
MRAVPDELDGGVVREIDARLGALDVAVTWAIESGSRAWGFPSPDSDYDCRFIFVRSIDSYLSPWPERDVIETPLDEVFDVNGWDLIKAVRLMLKGNAVVVEWLRSPIVYQGNEEFRDGLLALAAQVSNRALVERHYLHVGTNQWQPGITEMKLKKVFYSLRAAAVLRWMEVHPLHLVPPMNLQELLAECDPPADVVAEAIDLLAKKSVTRELGHDTIPPAIDRFLTDQYERAHETYERADGIVSDESREIASRYFRAAVERFGRQIG